MNDFYFISEINTAPIDEFQLENLGLERITMSFATRSRDYYGNRTSKTTHFSEKVKNEDYDRSFACKIIQVNPPYILDQLLNYHLKYYTDRSGEIKTFIKHIKYVVLEYIKKHYTQHTAHIELIEQWLIDHSEIKNENNMAANITGNNNVVNVAGGDIHQSGITLNVTENQYEELEKIGVEKIHIEELREIISNKTQDKISFKNKMVKWVSAVTVSLASKGLIESLPHLQQFAHHLIP